MKRRNHYYDRENNKCKKKMHFTFNFVKIIYFAGDQKTAHV